MNNPIHRINNKWYFWNETWSERHGGFPSREVCEQKLKEYCELMQDSEQNSEQDADT